MRSARFLILLILVICFTGMRLLNAQNSSDCIAIITEINGKALLKASGMSQFAKASWGDQLFGGDQVATGDKSEVRLLYSDNSYITLGPNSMITISGGESHATEPMSDIRHIPTGMGVNLSSLTIKKKEAGRDVGALAGVRSADMEQAIDLETPYNTIIKTDHPAFSWFTNLTFDRYTVNLYNSDGLVWSRKVSESSMNYPEGEKGLEFGKSYFWNVEGEYLIDTDKSASHKFTILPADKSGEVTEKESVIRNSFSENPESSTLHSVLGAFYIDQGLLQDAIGEFLIVAKINSDASIPHEILGSLYSEVGEKDKAIAELKIALNLTNNKGN
jgi:hypothetical protein